MWLSRAASLLPVLAFIALALILSGPVIGWRTVGLMGAITPTVLFIGSVTNPSGLELAANLAFIAALLRLRRDGPDLAWWCWAAVIASGIATILAWQLGPVFAALDLTACAALMGRDRRRLWSERPRHVLGALLVLIAAAVAFVVWGALSGVLHSTVSFSSGVSGLSVGEAQLLPTLKGAVGTFGLYSVFLPSAIVDLWWLAVIALIAGGWWFGTRRERIVLSLATLAGIALPIVFFTYSYQRSGFGLQARYVLPALALIPMLAGDAIDHRTQRSHGRRSAAWLGHAARVAVAALAILQLYAWWFNAHAWSGTNALILHHSQWSPPAGWTPWLAAAALGAIAILASATVNRPPRLTTTNPTA
jgi:hypothetical protein